MEISEDRDNFKVDGCQKGIRYKGGPKDGQLVMVAFFTSGYIGCPIIGKCGTLCTAFYRPEETELSTIRSP
ncbi:MAG: hypothetical protein WCX17_03900 [Parcubacteria group bacterium]|jgi:hypothetical protein